MNSINFCGGETSGSIAKINNKQDNQVIDAESVVNFRGKGAESAGSIAKLPITEPINKDIVSFKGYDREEKKSSFLGKLLGLTVLSAAVIAGLGYAHKTNIIDKIKNQKLHDLLKNSDKITEPCYNLCVKTKNFCTEYYNKAKNYFSK